MDALGVARDLGADDARRVALALGAMDAPDPRAVDHFDLESADRGAIVRADGRTPDDVAGRADERGIHRAHCAEAARARQERE